MSAGGTAPGGVPEVASGVASGIAPGRRPLWLALRFPQLPIDRSGDPDDETPRAIVVPHGSTRQIMACNAAAHDAGIRAGLGLSNAYALLPDLAIDEFDEVAQQQELERLTLWALGLSSRVTPQAPDTLLLEIGASLRLFGGLKPLLVRVREDLAEQGVTVSRGVAPTPAAARLFALIGQSRPVRDVSRLPLALGEVPVARLPLDAFAFKGLHRSGVRTLGELMALSATSLTRRFGAALVDWLYRLDGRLPDPQTPWLPSETFMQGVDLSLEAPDTGALAFPLNRLLGALGGYMTSRDVGVRRLDLHLHHHKGDPTRVSLRFLDATADVRHLHRVATERLDRETLPAPVVRLTLEAADLAGIERAGRDLFDRAAGGANGGGAGAAGSATRIEQVLDRLTARLGPDALYTAVPGDDHRPEKAWLQTLLGTRRPPADWPARPLWLYPEPKRAHGTLVPTTPPERIENGWWGEDDVRRDYFIARDAAGAHFWVFHRRNAPHELWVHGVFA